MSTFVCVILYLVHSVQKKLFLYIDKTLIILLLIIPM